MLRARVRRDGAGGLLKARFGLYIVSAQLSAVAYRHLCIPVDYILGSKLTGLWDFRALINLPRICCQLGGKSGAAKDAIDHVSRD